VSAFWGGGLGERVSQAPGDVLLVEPPAELLALRLLALAVADPVGQGNRVPGPFHEDSDAVQVLLWMVRPERPWLERSSPKGARSLLCY
jgi:hypothetical protein